MKTSANFLTGHEIAKIKNIGSPVIIFGAGIVGEVIYHACEETGLKVECFCDNNINKTKSTVCGVKVFHSPELKEIYKKAVFFISAADIKDVISQLSALGFNDWYPGSLLLRNLDIHKYKFSVPMDFVEYAVGTCLLCHDGFLNPEKIFIRSVDIIITERCSLRCRDCSNLMQYYKKPKDCGIEELLKEIDMFCAVVDEVNEFRVIGGEPFMNKEVHLVVKRLVDEPKVKKVVIYTNGTVVPKEEQLLLMKSRKLLVIITDYGAFSRKLEALKFTLAKNSIAFYAPKVHGWTSCSKLLEHGRTEKEQMVLFENCCSKNVITLSGGKVYRCPFSANACRLKATPEFKDDYFDITAVRDGIASIKKRLRAFLSEKEYLKTCDYCNGRSFDAPEIEPAVQTKVPLEYKRYSGENHDG